MKNGEIIFEAMEAIASTEAKEGFEIGVAKVKAAHGITMTEPEEEYLLRFYGRHKARLSRVFDELHDAPGGKAAFVAMCDALWAAEGDQYK